MFWSTIERREYFWIRKCDSINGRKFDNILHKDRFFFSSDSKYSVYFFFSYGFVDFLFLLLLKKIIHTEWIFLYREWGFFLICKNKYFSLFYISILIKYTHKSMYQYSETDRKYRCEYPNIDNNKAWDFFLKDKVGCQVYKTNIEKKPKKAVFYNTHYLFKDRKSRFILIEIPIRKNCPPKNRSKNNKRNKLGF